MKYYFSLMLVALFAACTVSRPARNCDTFSEAPDPAPDTLADWGAVSQHLNVSFGAIDTRYAKSSVPATDKVTAWAGCGWRGERISAQAVLWSVTCPCY